MFFSASPLPAQTAASAPASPPQWRHALSLLGTPHYPLGFKHFDYVNPQAPKGGVLRLASTAAFDSFNIVLAKGISAPGLSLIYDTLMAASKDEVSTEYGALADAAKYPDDFSWVTYRLRPEARWHDGTPVTADDVIWSFQVLTKHSPLFTGYYAGVKTVEKTGAHEVTFTFDAPGNRERPYILGQMFVLPKHWWEGTDAEGKKRDITQTTLEIPLGSGAYRVKTMVAGRTVEYERVNNWWAKDLALYQGHYNFDAIKFDTYRDETVALEAFKADQYDWRAEASAKSWVTAYKFPAAEQKNVVLEEIPQRDRGIMQAFAFNLRRTKFQDARVRRAFNYAFDFEEMSTTLFYGQYQRINSYFYGTELASGGLPSERELKILEPLRDKIPPEVFTAPYENPKGGNAEAVRNNLREAVRLLTEAGWSVKNGKLTQNETGSIFKVEILMVTASMERVATPFKTALEKLGFEVTLRQVDPSQYVERLRKYDYDIVVALWAQTLSPGNEQRDFWSSKAADTEGSRNWAGIKNPAVDALIERVIYAADREDLIAATRALDRVLLWNHYVVPQFSAPVTRTARWDRFARPDPLPLYDSGFPEIWWYDAEKAARIAGPR